MKKLLIFFIIAVLLGGVYYFERTRSAEKKKKEEKQRVLLDFTREDVMKIDLKNDISAVTFEKMDDGLWYMTYPEKMLADNTTVNHILTGFSCMRKQDSIGSDPDLKKYDLDKDFIDVTFHLKDGTNQSLHIGDSTPSGDSNYALKDNSNEVVLICSSYISYLSKPPIEYKNKALWSDKQNIVQKNLEKVIVRKGKKSIVIQKNADGKWAAQGAKDITIEQINGFVKMLTTHEAERFVGGRRGHIMALKITNPEIKIFLYCKGLPAPLELDIGKADPIRGILWAKPSNTREVAGLSFDFYRQLKKIFNSEP